MPVIILMESVMDLLFRFNNIFRKEIFTFVTSVRVAFSTRV